VCCVFHVTFHSTNNCTTASEERLGQFIQKLKKVLILSSGDLEIFNACYAHRYGASVLYNLVLLLPV
jgi:hypothetical protein